MSYPGIDWNWCVNPGHLRPVGTVAQDGDRRVRRGPKVMQHAAQLLHLPIYLGRHAAEHDLFVVVIADLCDEHLERPSLIAARRFHVAWLDSLGINNGFAMVVSGDNKKLETLSNAARSPKPWALGVGYEFEQRVDGLKALQQTYALRSNAIKTMDLGLLYRALEDGQVTMIAANATDGLLSKLDVKALDDDKHAFPPYELCIAAREDRLSAVPGLRAALAELSGKFSDRKMQELNYEVDGRHRPVAEVAAEFLRSIGD